MTKRRSRKPARAAADRPDFRPVLQDLAASRSSIVSVFSDFCRIAACGLAMQTREEEYLERIAGYSEDELSDQFAKAVGYLIIEMDAKPFQDVLGHYYTESIATADKRARGEFYTPPVVSQMMARMTLDVEKIKADQKPVTVADPCCGSGATILACAQVLNPHHELMRVTLQDVNPVACDMAYINTTLWGIPAEIILGNTLANERRGHWKNIHWHRVGEDQRQAAGKMLSVIRELSAIQEAATPLAEGEHSLVIDDVLIQPPPVGPHEQLGLF